MQPSRLVALWGEEHEVLGEVADARLGERSAVALSRGRFPKPYHHVDANEDAVLAAAGPAGRLLAVADGHFGFDAARAALAAVAALADDLLATPRKRPAQAVEESCHAAHDAVVDAVRGAREPRCDSRTALTLALATGGHLFVATYGDTACVRARGGRAKVVGGTSSFLGPGAGPPRVARVRLRAGDRVAVASDGLTDYLGRQWAARVAGMLAEAGDARAVARALVGEAMDGGAGDHVAVGVLL